MSNRVRLSTVAAALSALLPLVGCTKEKQLQAVAKDWQEQLGINVAIIVRELKVFRNDLKSQNYMVSRGSWFGDYGDPTTFLDLNRADDGNNDRKYASAEYDGILNEAREQADPDKRLALLTKAERLIVEEDVPLIPIFTYV